jgi:hypothetical protein
MEPEGSSPHSQASTIGPYPEPNPIRASQSHLSSILIILPSNPCFPKWSLSRGSPR